MFGIRGAALLSPTPCMDSLHRSFALEPYCLPVSLCLAGGKEGRMCRSHDIVVSKTFDSIVVWKSFQFV